MTGGGLMQLVAYGAQEKSPHRDCPFAAGLRSRSDGGSSCNASSESHGKSRRMNYVDRAQLDFES